MIYLEQVESDSQKQLVQFIIEEYHSYVPSAVSVGRRIDWLIYDDTIVNQFSLPQPIGMIGIGSSVYPPPKDLLTPVISRIAIILILPVPFDQLHQLFHQIFQDIFLLTIPLSLLENKQRLQ